MNYLDKLKKHLVDNMDYDPDFDDFKFSTLHKDNVIAISYLDPRIPSTLIFKIEESSVNLITEILVD